MKHRFAQVAQEMRTHAGEGCIKGQEYGAAEYLRKGGTKKQP